MHRALLAVLLAGVALAAPADNSVLIGNGSTYQPKTFSDCTGAAQAVRYTDSTNTLSCGTVSGVAASGLACSDCVELGAETTGGYAASTTEGGPATTATALAANGGDCTAGNAPLGVDTLGAVESCFDVATQAELDTHAALTAPHSATAANTANRIVLRGAAGEFAAGAITASLVGNASTATALAANPADCGAGTFATTIAANGDLTCSAAGLTKFTEAESTAAPNATVYVDSLTAAAASTNADVAFVAKGSGATLAQIPDSTAAGGNKRGAYATDWQRAHDVGGQAQVASGAYSVVGGGASNTASGQWSTVAGGEANIAREVHHNTVGGGYGNVAGQATGGGRSYATVGGGNSNYATGAYSAVAGGTGNTAGAYGCTVAGGDVNAASAGSAGGSGEGWSTVGGGAGNVADGWYSTIPGGSRASARDLYARFSYASGQFSGRGDAQMGIHVTRRSTSNATAARLSADGAAPGTRTVNVLPNSYAYIIRAEVVARENTTGDAKMWLITAGVRRGATAATTALVAAATVTVVAADAGAAAWTATVVADTTRGSIEVEVAGEAAKTIRWVATMYTTEVGG